MGRAFTQEISIPNRQKVTLIIIVLVMIAILAALFLPPGIDWGNTYRPAALAAISGKSPFTIPVFFTAPWSVIAMIPLAILPESIGRGFLFVVSLLAFSYAAYRLGARQLGLAAFLLSPPVLHCLLNGNIDWLPILGFILPPQWGLLLVAVKPQIGIGITIYWGIEAYRLGGLRQLFRIFIPLALVLTFSFLLYGFWPFRFYEVLAMTHIDNHSLWPASIPIGLALMTFSIRSQRPGPAFAAGLFFSPYVLLQSWVGALISLASYPAEMLAAVIGLWLLMLLRIIPL